MNVRVPTAVLSLLIAFASGWWLRGGSVGPGSGSNAPDGRVDPKAPRPQAEGIPGSLPTRRPRPPVDEAFTEADRRREAEDRRRLETRCREALERQIAEWRRLLDLGAAEVAALREAVGPVVEATDPPVAVMALPILEQRLRDLLDGDRREALDRLAFRRAEAAARAKAQARLAELNSVILLDPDQERQVGELLMEEGGHDAAPEISPAADLTPADLAEITRRMAEAGDDGTGYADVARDVVREGIEAKLRQLGGVLTRDQLESYRAHLEESRARWLADPP